MSQQIPVSYVDQFNSNVFHLSQQKGSRLQSRVRNESQSSESQFWDRIGETDPEKRTSRHQDTILKDTPHSRRKVVLEDYELADLVDSQDKLRTLNDPTNDYAVAFGMGFGRQKDRDIIAAGLGSAYGGQKGTTVIPLPDTQKIAADDGATVGGVNLNVLTLRRLKRMFDANEVGEELVRYLAVTSRQLEALLGETEVSSADFNTIRALVRGEIDTFLGFEFIRTELLPRAAAATTFTLGSGVVGAGGGTLPAATSRRCMAWAADGIMLATGKDFSSSVDKRPDKGNSDQVLSQMSIGATRMEEVKVVEVICNEA